VPETHQFRRLQGDGHGHHSALEAVRLFMVAAWFGVRGKFPAKHIPTGRTGL
jgi:hypothetical protein